MAAQINVSRRPMISSLVLPLFSSLIGRALPTVQRSRFGPILHPGDCCVQPAGLVKVMVLSSCCLVLPCSAVPDPPFSLLSTREKTYLKGPDAHLRPSPVLILSPVSPKIPSTRSCHSLAWKKKGFRRFIYTPTYPKEKLIIRTHNHEDQRPLRPRLCRLRVGHLC